MTNNDLNTLTAAIRDMKRCLWLSLSDCCFHGYDGAVNMQGIRNRVSVRVKKEEKAALSVYCLAHYINVCTK